MWNSLPLHRASCDDNSCLADSVWRRSLILFLYFHPRELNKIYTVPLYYVKYECLSIVYNIHVGLNDVY